MSLVALFNPKMSNLAKVLVRIIHVEPSHNARDGHSQRASYRNLLTPSPTARAKAGPKRAKRLKTTTAAVTRVEAVRLPFDVGVLTGLRGGAGRRSPCRSAIGEPALYRSQWAEACSRTSALAVFAPPRSRGRYPACANTDLTIVCRAARVSGRDLPPPSRLPEVCRATRNLPDRQRKRRVLTWLRAAPLNRRRRPVTRSFRHRSARAALGQQQPHSYRIMKRA